MGHNKTHYERTSMKLSETFFGCRLWRLCITSKREVESRFNKNGLFAACRHRNTTNREKRAPKMMLKLLVTLVEKSCGILILIKIYCITFIGFLLTFFCNFLESAGRGEPARPLLAASWAAANPTRLRVAGASNFHGLGWMGQRNIVKVKQK